jgi:trigger factor
MSESMNVTVSDAGPSRKKLAFTIPADRVTSKLKEQFDTLMDQAQLPGFRRGKAPRGLVERQFGAGVRSEAKQQLIGEAYGKAVEEHKLKVIGEPSAEKIGEIELKEGQPLMFEVEVEVQPEFEMPKVDGLEIKKPKLTTSDAMVQEEINKILINEGTLDPRESPEPGDYITGHGIMKEAKGEKEHYNINGCVVQVPTADKNGKGMILGIMVDDFAKQLGTPKANDMVTIKATGPENHEVEALRKTPVVITFKVIRIDRIIPAKLDQVVAAFGMGSEDMLREAIRNRLTQRVVVQQQVAMRQQLAKHLVDNTKIELPEKMTASQAARTLERQRMEMMYRGMEPQQIEERVSELRAASASSAASELKLFFILNKAADDLGVKVTEQEMNGRIAQMAAERNAPPEQLRQELIRTNQVGAIYMQIREHKAFDALLSKCTITEVEPEALVGKKK